MGQRTNRVEKGWGRVQTKQQFLSLSLSTYSKVFFFFFFLIFNSKPFAYTISFLFYTKRLYNGVLALLNSIMFCFLIIMWLKIRWFFFPTWQHRLNCKKRLILLYIVYDIDWKT